MLQNPEDIFNIIFGGGRGPMGGFYEDPVMSGKVGRDLQASLEWAIACWPKFPAQYKGGKFRDKEER